MTGVVVGDLLLLAAGHGVLALVATTGRREGWPFGLLGGMALSFLAGVAMVSSVVTLIGVLGGPVRPLPIVGPLMAGIAVAGGGVRLQHEAERGAPWRQQQPPESGWRALLPGLLPTTLILAASVRLLAIAHTRVVEANDEYAIWVLKGRVLSLIGRLDPHLFTNSAYHYAHLDYPLLLPSLVAWTDAWNGGSSDPAVEFQIVLLVSGMLGAVAWALQRLGGPGAATAGVLVLAATAAVGTNFPALGVPGGIMADVPLNCFAVTTAAMLMLWLRRADRAYLGAAAVLAAGSFLTKNEGLAFTLAAFVAAFTVARGGWAPRRQLAVTVGAALLAYLPWFAFLQAHDISNDAVNEVVPRTVELRRRSMLDQAASSLVGVTAAMVWSSAARSAGRWR
jgi:hypothetical protein